MSKQIGIAIKRIARKQCYICFKKFDSKATSPTECCSPQCKQKYEEVKKEKE